MEDDGPDMTTDVDSVDDSKYFVALMPYNKKQPILKKFVLCQTSPISYGQIWQKVTNKLVNKLPNYEITLKYRLSGNLSGARSLFELDSDGPSSFGRYKRVYYKCEKKNGEAFNISNSNNNSNNNDNNNNNNSNSNDNNDNSNNNNQLINNDFIDNENNSIIKPVISQPGNNNSNNNSVIPSYFPHSHSNTQLPWPSSVSPSVDAMSMDNSAETDNNNQLINMNCLPTSRMPMSGMPHRSTSMVTMHIGNMPSSIFNNSNYNNQSRSSHSNDNSNNNSNNNNNNNNNSNENTMTAPNNNNNHSEHGNGVTKKKNGTCILVLCDVCTE